MSMALLERLQLEEAQVEATAAGREQHRIRLVKIVCMLVLGVCFWFSVPYQFPISIDTDLVKSTADEATAYEGSVARQIAVPLIAFLSLWMLWRLPKRGSFRGPVMTAGLLYCGWVGASLLWSATPGVTGKRLIVFAVDALFAVTLARCFSVTEMAAFGFAATSAVALIAVYVDVLMEKRFAPFDPDYRFMGVMTANYQAMSLVVGMICALTLAMKKPHWLKWIAPCVAVELVLLYLTRSRLGTILGLVMLSVLVLRLMRQRVRAEMRALTLLTLLAVVAPALVYVAGSKGFDAAQTAFMLGRRDTENTASLSNRAPLWAELMESVERRPLLGFGYAGFWTPARVETVSLNQGWTVPNAHDTYLDQTLSLGVVGACFYIAMLWGACFVAWRRNARERTAESLFPAILLTWLALTSLAESAPLDPYLPTMLAYACIAKMALAEGSEQASVEPEEEAPLGGLSARMAR